MNSCDPIRVCILYPADPVGTIAGGIDTFIRGVIDWAPDDIQFGLIGATTDGVTRPVGQWTVCELNRRKYEFLPLLSLEDKTRQSRIPVTVKFSVNLTMRSIDIDADILEFHRIESSLHFLRDPRPKTLVMHQNMADLRNEGSDIRWKYAPGLYYRLEDYLLPKFDRISCVREDAVREYQRRLPSIADRVKFCPTWVDVQQFSEPSSFEREQSKSELCKRFGFGVEDFVLVTVGRLDKQKNPLLLIDAFRRLADKMPDIRLVFVGDGVLREQVERQVSQLGLSDKVKIAGIQPVSQVASILQGSDIFVLSSAYEGMPMCVLEALGTGLPVVSTDVGEVARVVISGNNGELVTEHEGRALALAVEGCRRKVEQYRGSNCIKAIEDYTPEKVLSPVYQSYRRLGSN